MQSYMIVLVLTLGCGAVLGVEDYVRNINEEVDYILGNYTADMGDGEFDLEGITKTINTTVLGIRVEGELSLIGGWFKNISSLKRMGDATLTRLNDTTSRLNVVLTMSTAEAGVDNVTLEAFGHSASGYLKLVEGYNRLEMQIVSTVHPDNSCKSIVDYIKMTELGGFKFTLGPPNFVNKITSGVITENLNLFSFLIKFGINRALHELVLLMNGQGLTDCLIA